MHPMLMLKRIITILCFLTLTGMFYYALLDALKKQKDNPISFHKLMRGLTPNDLRMKTLYDRSAKWMSYSRSEKLENLLDNPVFTAFNITKPKKKKYATLLLIVSSGPRRVDRRDAIRDTWWSECKPTSHGVTPVCLFFTDRVQPDSKYYKPLIEENKLHNDMRFQPLSGGIEFGVRFLYHMVWALTYYDFDYFMRSDDDYFLCLERVLWEIPRPMVRRFHWGFVHCIEEIVRPEESMILLSRDLIEYFLMQDPFTIRCHPWADQMIAVWVTDLGDNHLFRHDDRLHHAPVVDQMPELRTIKDKCHKFMGIHGTYPEDMRLFWKQRGIIYYNFTSNSDRGERIGNLFMNSAVCELVHNFNYLVFEPEWQYEPQRCIYNPVWNTEKQAVIGGVYSGRQDDRRLSDQDLKLFKTVPRQNTYP